MRHESDELEECLLSHCKRKVKDLQALLWSERGKRGSRRIRPPGDSDFLRAKALEHTSCVEEKLWIGFAVY